MPPIFEFKCNNPKCDHKQEKIRNVRDADQVIKCPVCKGDAVRIWSVTGKPVFKGKGFYETDYKGK